MNKKEFLKILDKAGAERLRIRLIIGNGKLQDLVIQYETLINEKWIVIVRYDLEHGFFHRDLMTPKGEKIKTVIEMPDLRTAATYAEQDIKDKWEFYKEKYLKQIRNDKQRNH
jgi:hypothetical protein